MFHRCYWCLQMVHAAFVKQHLLSHTNQPCCRRPTRSACSTRLQAAHTYIAACVIETFETRSLYTMSHLVHVSWIVVTETPPHDPGYA